MSTQTGDSSVPPATAPGTSSPPAGSLSSSVGAAEPTPSQINMVQLLTIVREQVTEVVREAVRDSGAPPSGSMTPSGGRPRSGLTGVGPLSPLSTGPTSSASVPLTFSGWRIV